VTDIGNTNTSVGHGDVTTTHTSICVTSVTETDTGITKTYQRWTSLPLFNSRWIFRNHNYLSGGEEVLLLAKFKKSVEQFVSECPICHGAKTKHYHYTGLLAPLPIPQLALSFISMDFVEGLPKSGTKNTILVVVNRLTKYAHFIALSHPFIAQTIAQLFIDNIFKLMACQLLLL
jgi:hypothetical protein